MDAADLPLGTFGMGNELKLNIQNLLTEQVLSLNITLLSSDSQTEGTTSLL